ncbi:prephenate dehydratase [Nitratiruptor tergarcus]|uniref:Bifunctional chorismate mutase/prephenate dehydratase n=1 Tax=Nitratiruptor tergarcus DSM 16512 TaxID=1069081 RepID=A0A1W1WTJ1_9BACT|nr:prephenate dehydratase [Nitratiruptor tergarcus]SMC09063.1 chorismate mutase [Nitratiruptor tergarcus DSM 16512]
MDEKLQKLREEIDSIDDAILELLNKRMEVVKKVGELKNRTNAPIYRPEREIAILNRLKEKNRGPLNDKAIEAIFLEIFAVSRNLERPERVAYLGPEGSFTHQAAESRFGAMSEYLPTHSIAAVFKSVEAQRAKYGVVPIENSIDGVVGETLDLLGKSDLKIVAEVYMPIHHSFASLEEDLKKIKKIYSKDIAFGQCRNFLQEHFLEDVEQIPVESTAKAAMLAAKEPGSAAICSNIAAKLYNLPILFENIEDVHTNMTRFIVLSNFKNQRSGFDKTSILAKLQDRPGALVRFLEDFDAAKINLTKIESRPAEDKDFNYWFYIDFDGHVDDKNVQEVFAKHKKEIKWLGSYAKGEPK